MTIEDLIKEPRDIVEQIMAQHWDLAACQCWICRHGRKMGCGVYDEHLDHKMGVVEVSDADR
jgi:hypothetical protein